MTEKHTHGNCSTVIMGEQREAATERKSHAILKKIVRQLNAVVTQPAVVTRPAVKTLHIRELTTTTVLAFGLFFSSSVAAFELELKPTLDMSKAYQVAGVCFLTDCLDEVMGGNALDDIEISHEAAWCEENGYLLTCPDNTTKVPNKDCPRDHNYGTCSMDQFCKDKGYVETPTTCKKKGANYYVDTTQKCPNGQEFYKKCVINNQQACKDAGYVTSCSSGRMYANSNRCPYDNTYGKCCTAAPSTGCPSGYTVTCTGATSGTDTCGYACKQCCSYSTRSSYCYDRCLFPGPNSCVINGATYYSGCGLSKCGRKESCNSGTCVCDSAYYQYACTGTGYSGGVGAACGGKFESCNCSSGYNWEGGVCKKKTVWFYCCNDGSVSGCNYSSSKYDYCKQNYGHLDCSQMQASCTASGGTLSLINCSASIYSIDRDAGGAGLKCDY